jgi:hypothetical protein
MVRITRYPDPIRAAVVSAPVRGAIHGYVFDGERYRTIDFPGATRTEAWDITNSGDVIGYYANADGRLHGFRLDKRGRYTKFDDPDGELENDLTGGNDRGVTVGSLLRYDPAMGGGPRVSAERPRQVHHSRRPRRADHPRLENQQPRPGGRAGAAAVPPRLHL